MALRSKCMIFVVFILVFPCTLKSAHCSLTDGSSVPAQITEEIVTYICSPLFTTFESILYIASEAIDFVFLPFVYLTSGITEVLYFTKGLCESVVAGLFIILDLIIRAPVLLVIQMLGYIVNYVLCKPLVLLINNIIVALNMPFHAVTYDEIVLSLLQNVFIIPVEFVFNSLMTVIQVCFDILLFLSLDILLHMLIENTAYFILESIFSIPLLPPFLLHHVICMFSYLLKHILSLICNLVLSVVWSVIAVIVFICVFILHWILEIFLAVMLAVCCVVFLFVGGVVCLGMYCLYLWRFGDLGSNPLIQYIEEKLDEVLSDEFSVLHYFLDELPIGKLSSFRQLSTKSDTFSDDDENSEKLCVVCFHEKPLIRIESCGHTNVCRQCLEQIVNINNKCPLCRSVINPDAVSWNYI